jgi:hypothetical protein
MYLVTCEHDDDGMWFEDPEGFDAYSQALEYVNKKRSRLSRGTCFVIYRCEEIDTFLPQTPQESGQ